MRGWLVAWVERLPRGSHSVPLSWVFMLLLGPPQGPSKVPLMTLKLLDFCLSVLTLCSSYMEVPAYLNFKSMNHMVRLGGGPGHTLTVQPEARHPPLWGLGVGSWLETGFPGRKTHE